MLTWTLTLIWSMVLLGAAGVIWLMLGTFRLEQRRGDFVSAVTHELRTPLTSFSLYTEMLEDGMVPEQKKPEYYANMQRECRRLEHLIENVLSYSRLQRNAIRRARDTLTCQELLNPLRKNRTPPPGGGHQLLLCPGPAHPHPSYSYGCRFRRADYGQPDFQRH